MALFQVASRSVEEQNAEWTRRLDRKEVWAERVLISPALAKLLLMRNNTANRNRKADHNWVSKLARDMTANKGKFTGETIIVASDGEINDGQHRLMAVVKSGISFETFVAFGVAPDTRDVVDMGNRRRGSAVADMHGFVGGEKLMAAVQHIMTYQAHGVFRNIAAYQSTHQEKIAWLRGAYGEDGGAFSHTHLVPVKEAAKYSKASPAVLAALHFLFWQKSSVQADWFFDRFGDGVGFVRKNHPIMKLRDEFHAGAVGKGQEYIAVIYAWNRVRAGKNASAAPTID